MQKRSAKSAKKGSLMGVGIARGVVVGLIVSITALLAVALLVKETGLEESSAAAIDQAVKIAAILAASITAARIVNEKHLIAGMLSSVIFMVLSFIIFSLVEGQAGDFMLLLADTAMAAAIGALSGVIFGKLLKKEQRTTGNKKVGNA